MYLEAVIVCVNYSDFLAITLPRALEVCERVVVVSHYDDKATHQLCDKYSTDCIKTDVFHEDGDMFNKGRAINLGLSNLRHEPGGWLLHIDADIYLPHRFKHALKMAKLDPKTLYGCDRLNCYSWEDWQRYKAERLSLDHPDRLAGNWLAQCRRCR